MDGFSSRDKFITSMMFLMYNPTYKKTPKQFQVAFLQYLREKIAPVPDEEWKEIARNITKTCQEAKSEIMKALFVSRMDPRRASADHALMKLDAVVRDNMKELDLDEITKGIETDDVSIKNALDEIKKMKKDFGR